MLRWVLVLVGLTFPVLVARAVWEADWLYLVAVALLAVAGLLYLAWQWRGNEKRFAVYAAALAAIVMIAFIWQKVFG